MKKILPVLLFALTIAFGAEKKALSELITSTT